jgi:hypothetical protein
VAAVHDIGIRHAVVHDGGVPSVRFVGGAGGVVSGGGGGGAGTGGGGGVTPLPNS